LKVQKDKNRFFYNIGLLVILIGFTYVFITNKIELYDCLKYIFITVSGLSAGARAYYFDRYLRIARKAPIVDLWLFLNETKIERIMATYFLIKPIYFKTQEKQLKETRNKINLYTFCSYIFLIGFIIILVLKK